MALTYTGNVTAGTLAGIDSVAKALKMAMPLMAYPMFGRGDEMTRRVGKTVQWFRPATITETTAAASDDQPPTWTPTTYSVDVVSNTLSNFFGTGVAVTETVEAQSIWDIRPDLLQMQAQDAGRKINGYTRQKLLAGATTIYYANNKTSVTLTSADTPDMDDFFEVARILKDADAPGIMVDGKECYVAFISPKVERYLLNDSGFKSAVAYQAPQRLFFGYLAVYGDICFVRTSSANAARTTVTGISADQTIVVGADAYGVTRMPLLGSAGTVPQYTGLSVGIPSDLSNGLLQNSFQLLETLPGDGNGNGAHGDEYAAQHKVTWKALYQTTILNSNWIVNFRSAY